MARANSWGMHTAAGFTLIEVVIAVFVLAASMVVLIGLQTSSMQRAIRDRNKQQAMLFARRIMAEYESLKREAEDEEKTDSVLSFLDDISDDDLGSEEQRVQLERFTAQLSIQDWPLPGIDEILLKRLGLVIFWSESPLDRVELVLLVPAAAKGN